MSKHYNSKVRHRDLQIGDLVLRKVMGAAKDPSQGRKAWTKLGRALQDHVLAKEGHLPPRNTGRTETSASMEHGTPSEILPIEMMVDNFPLSPSLFTLLVLKIFDKFLLISFLCLDKFLP